MKIDVTKEHIRNGKRGKPGSCPLALALKDANCENPSVCCRYCFYTRNGKAYEGILSRKTSKKIIEFDSGGDIEPFTCIVKERPDKSL